MTTNKKDWRDVPQGCCLPWTGFSNVPSGRVRPCCIFETFAQTDDGKDIFIQEHTPEEIINSKYFTDLRQEFVDGKMPAGCFRCKQDEATGVRSKRITENENLGHFINLDAVALPKVINLQTILNNACNLKCRSCNGEHSSTWMKELSKPEVVALFPKGQSSKPSSKFWTTREEWLKDLQVLEIMGGEPFYTAKWKTIFNELIESGVSKNIHLRLSTNCTIFDEPYVKSLEENFKSLGISLSIDGVGKLFEFMRYPGVWDEAEVNAKGYYNVLNASGGKSRIHITYTLSWLNAAGYIEFSEWAKENLPGVNVWVNFLYGPIHLNLRNAPDHIKEHINKKLAPYISDKNVADTLALLNQPRNFSIDDTLNFIAIDDKKRGQNWEDLFK